MKKRIICLLVTMIMLIGCSIPVCASSEDETKLTVLTLEENSITDVGNRHIKVTWGKVENATVYKLEIADNNRFENAVSKTTKKTNQLYWNFADVPGDVKDTYYIRIKPCFVYSKTEGGYEYVYGQWSNVVIAEYKEPEPINQEALKNINWFPWISKNINFGKLLKVDWSKILIDLK